MKQITIDGITLVKLKDEKFEYCGKTYTQQRFITKDKKILITSDNGFDYTLIYTAQPNGSAKIFDDGIYYKDNRHSYPIYCVDEAIKIIKKHNITSEFELEIHSSQFFGARSF